MEKQCNVIMIPSDKSSYGPELILEKNCFGETYLKYLSVPWIPNSEERQHLLFLSDDPIKEGDWCIMLDSFGHVFSNPQQYLGEDKGHFLNKGLRKIIASTNPDLKLPRPKETFIIDFVSSYNEGNPISVVKVQYTYDIHKYGITHHARENYRPKVDKENKIEITFKYTSLEELKDIYISSLEGLVILLEDNYDHEERHIDITELKSRIKTIKTKLDGRRNN